MAHVELRFGEQTWTVNVRPEQLLELRTKPRPTPTQSPAELVAAALDHPFGFESMRRAVTPDDQVVIVVDHSLPDLPGLIATIVAHLASAGISNQGITLLSPPDAAELAVDGIRQEIHDPENRKKLAYLATTGSGQRIYLNRTLVEADFCVVLSSRRYDLGTGYAGAEAMIYPQFSDSEARETFVPDFIPETFPQSSQRKALVEVAWLLGTPFLIHVIEDGHGGVAAVAAGLLDSSVEGLRFQDERWRANVAEEADVVIACVNAAPSELRFADLAFAAVVAARVVSSSGRIVILYDSNRDFRERRKLNRFEDAETAFAKLGHDLESLPSRAWAWVANHCKLVIRSGETEELFALGTDDVGDVQRLIDSASRLLIIPDAHRTLIQRL
jgi:nickel-dependent lactate racemase